MMQITIVDEMTGNLSSCQVDGSTLVADLKAILEAETGVPIAMQQIYFQNRTLVDSETLGPSGVNDGDVLQLTRRQPVQQQGQGQGQQWGGFGDGQNPLRDIRAIKNDPVTMMHLQHRDPDLHAAVRDEDISRFVALMTERKRAFEEKKAKEEKFMALAASDNMDPEIQRQIEEYIREKNVEESYNSMMENSPELLVGQISMLYVNMEVNGIAVKSFIDSGAQMTIMTQEFAERCGLTRLIDSRFQGMAVGVGSSKIIGKIHQAPLKVGGHHIASSITVLEQKVGPPFIFGLDNLRRHQCNIDLKNNELAFGSCPARLHFLSEAEIQGEFGHSMLEEAAATNEETAPGQRKRPAEDAGTSSRSLNPPPAPVPSAPPPASEHEAKIKKLMALGFSRDECERALRMTGGNEEFAAAALFSNGM